MIVYPNAKINIGLNVVEKRADGFHNIESIFYPIYDIFDVLEIVENQKKVIEFTFSGIEIPGEDASNLCIKAFQLIQKDFSIPFVKIHLHKNIPIGAGLGGGSSDAAFTLVALNKLFDLNLSTTQLMDYSRKLGSDCAFFIQNKPVYAYHKGDEFESIALDLSSYKIKIESPKIHIGTITAYAGIKPLPSKTSLKQLIAQPIENWKNSIKNDFETPVFKKFPEINVLKKKMYIDGAIFASMTGSGSSIYGIFKK